MTVPPSNLDTVLASFEELWSPRLLAQVNDHDVKLAKIRGGSVWHAHPDSDELFLVLAGELDIRLRDATSESVVRLGTHDVHVVPRGAEHCPVSERGATVLLIEMTGTLSTGGFAGDAPDHIRSTTGLPAEE